MTNFPFCKQKNNQKSSEEAQKWASKTSILNGLNLWMSHDGKELMPMWCPPTPPQDDSDVYVDKALSLLYETTIMSEAQLPPIFVKKEKKRSRVEAGLPEGSRAAVKVRPREEAMMHAPRSLFDRPTAALIKMRQELRLQRYKGLMRPNIPNLVKPQQAVKPIPEPEHIPDWIIQEEYAILQAIQQIQELPLNLTIVSPGQTPNWDMIAELINLISRTFRSSKQCRNRYESVIIPREEGKLVLDSARKQKKNKTIYKVHQIKSGRPLRTSQLFQQDSGTSISQVMNSRFDAIKNIANRRAPTNKPLLVDPTLKNPKHAEVLAESNIDYENPLNPVEIASRRADRIAKEKQQQQLSQSQTVTNEQLAVLRLKQQLVPKSTAAATITTTTITVQASTTTMARTVNVQEFTPSTSTVRVVSSPTSQGSTIQRTTTNQTIVSSPSTPTTTIGKATKINAQLLYRQQQQQLQIRQANQLRVIQSRTGISPGQKVSVIAPGSPRYSVKGGSGVSRTVSESEVVALLKRQQIASAKLSTSGTTLTSAQILAQAGLQSTSTSVGHVTAVTLPVTNLQVKTGLANTKTGTMTPQQVKHLQQQLIAQRKLSQQKVMQIGPVKVAKAGTTQLIVQSPKSTPTTMTMQQFQQAIKHAQPQHVQGTSAQVIAHQVFTKAQGVTPARVIPVASGSQQSIKHAIQVVSTGTTRTVPSVTIDASGRTSQTALATTIKTGSQPQAILTQPLILPKVSAVIQPGQQLMRQPVRIQTSSPLVAVTVSQPQTVLTLPSQDNNQQQQ